MSTIVPLSVLYYMIFLDQYRLYANNSLLKSVFETLRTGMSIQTRRQSKFESQKLPKNSDKMSSYYTRLSTRQVRLIGFYFFRFLPNTHNLTLRCKRRVGLGFFPPCSLLSHLLTLDDYSHLRRSFFRD